MSKILSFRTAKSLSPGAPKPRGARSAVTVAAGIVLLFWLVMALIGPWVVPHDPAAVLDGAPYGGMSAATLFGTDVLGRDVFSRVMAGTQVTVGVALAATCVAVLLGGALGMFAAVLGGAVDIVLSRFFDAVVSLPVLLIGLISVAALGSSVPVLIGTAGFIYMPGSYRIWRSLAADVHATDFIRAARGRGEGLLYLVFREILPNIARPAAADFGLRFVFVVLLISSLGFLGLGIQPPQADWGSLVKENMSGLMFGAPAVIWPALALATLTIAVNMLVDGWKRKGAEHHE
ncbi:ABC transporter permease [Caballeronia sp. AZ7_KS35]|uniref:ABC transporter permease n=1 Tax=Caballeronia sp. AZ7_KS35 TaxID=2921762 RepID=UPI002027A6EB|nr:ABC transporter permease [Caballeronia sp. AZ7_KS35]